MGQYRHHVFVYTSGRTCAKQGAGDVHEAMKKAVKESGLEHAVRVDHDER